MLARIILPLLATIAISLCGCSRPSGGEPKGGEDTGPRTLTLLTYNVMVDPIDYSQRREKLNALLGACDADLIALQEVSDLHAEELAAADWVKRGGYRYLQRNNAPWSWRAIFILSRFPIERVDRLEIGSVVGRGALIVRVRVAGRSVAVGSIWLDSRPEFSATRAKELDVVFAALKDADDAVLMGDFNFGDGEQPESAHLDPAYTDLWRALRPGEPGLTWNIERSSLARVQSFPNEKSRRLDRILLRSAVWKPKSIRIIGDEPFKRVRLAGSGYVPISGEKADEIDIFPSDHFGLVATVARE